MMNKSSQSGFMKTNTIKLRSVFTSGVNLGNQIHKTKKGPGSYKRKNRKNEKLD